VYLLLESTEPLDEAECEALAMFADYLGDELLAWEYGSVIREPSREQLASITRLVEHYRACQLAHVEQPIARNGLLPSLRRARDDPKRTRSRCARSRTPASS
jgi:hypothetical protein